MAAARKIECFSLAPDELRVYAGNLSGEIVILDVDSWQVVGRVQAHAGSIPAMCCHRTQPYLAALSNDRTVSIWRINSGQLLPICRIPLRTIVPSNDETAVPYVHSESQAVGFHDTELRLVTRSANAGLAELSFDTAGNYQVDYCVRLHGTSDLTSTRFARGSNLVLSGSIDGGLVLSDRGREVRRWDIGASGNVHWAEDIGGSLYLIASDARCISLVDITRDGLIANGAPFTKDDLEHVTFNQHSGRAFVGSFDRTIYEIDINTCMPTRVAVNAPFKCRWVKTLERAPEIAIIQCRNGALYRASVESGEINAVLKETPIAYWTATESADGHLILGGEGENISTFKMIGHHHTSRFPLFSLTKKPLPISRESYTKRLVRHPHTRHLLLGRSDGEFVCVDDEMNLTATNVGSAIRDVAPHPTQPAAFLACENGGVLRVDVPTGNVVNQYASPISQPIWSLAYNKVHDLLAIGERTGSLTILRGDTLEVLFTGYPTARPKRMKWCDDNTLLMNRLDGLFQWDWQTGRGRAFVGSLGNTVEDFIWDIDRRYLVLIGYTCNLTLCDYTTGDVLWVNTDQMDYSKGLAWLPPNANEGNGGYPLDFITYGRSGHAHLFRIFNEKILALGKITIREESNYDLPLRTN